MGKKHFNVWSYYLMSKAFRHMAFRFHRMTVSMTKFVQRQILKNSFSLALLATHWTRVKSCPETRVGCMLSLENDDHQCAHSYRKHTESWHWDIT